MPDFTSVTKGPWRIRTSTVGEDKACIAYLIDGKSDLIASETHADLALLRDAIDEYLREAEGR